MPTDKVPRLVRFLAVHAIVGAAIAGLTVALILAGDVGGVRGLVARSDVGALALTVMTLFFMTTFAGVQMAVAVMLYLAEDPSEGRSRGRPPRLPALALLPARVRVHHPVRRVD